MRLQAMILCGVVGLLGSGCIGSSDGGAVNPYLTYLETFGIGGGGTDDGDGDGGGGDGDGTDAAFRRSMVLRFRNNHPNAQLDTSFIAWVDVSSVQTSAQQATLLDSGYVQLTQDTPIGSVYTLPVGTFVLNGPGSAGATPVSLNRATGDTGGTGGTVVPSSTEFSLVTPDTILVFSQPPVSCDSVAFTYSDPITGEVLQGGSTVGGGYKTLAQIDVYQCDPFRPGVFFNRVGGQFAPNEYMEGETVAFDFYPGSTAAGEFALVTMGESSTQP